MREERRKQLDAELAAGKDCTANHSSGKIDFSALRKNLRKVDTASIIQAKQEQIKKQMEQPTGKLSFAEKMARYSRK